MSKKNRARQKAQRRSQSRPTHATGAQSPFGNIGHDPATPSPRERAELCISQAVHALERRDGDELDRCLGLLVFGPGDEAWLRTVDRTLMHVIERQVRTIWARGWQPGEVVRAVRREHGARHGRLAVDLIAAQMRTYPSARVDERWTASLAALDARVWWETDEDYVTDWSEREGLHRLAVVTVVIEVLHLLAILPAVEQIGPLPGTARPTMAPPADLDHRMLDRVRALLAKAESTDFAEEADAYTAKAQELMARHRIDSALLAAQTGGTGEPATIRVGIDNPYEMPKSLLLQVVAETNSCRAVFTKRFGFTTVVGFPADLEATELVFTSLLVQATRSMTHAAPGPGEGGRSSIRSFRQSFLTSYATRIGERLRSTTTAVGEEMAQSSGGTGLLPVLAAREGAVQAAFERRFPELTQKTTTISNAAGWASGRAAADQASLDVRQAVAG